MAKQTWRQWRRRRPPWQRTPRCCSWPGSCPSPPRSTAFPVGGLGPGCSRLWPSLAHASSQCCLIMLGGAVKATNPPLASAAGPPHPLKGPASAATGLATRASSQACLRSRPLPCFPPPPAQAEMAAFIFGEASPPAYAAAHRLLRDDRVFFKTAGRAPPMFSPRTAEQVCAACPAPHRQARGRHRGRWSQSLRCQSFTTASSIRYAVGSSVGTCAAHRAHIEHTLPCRPLS